MSDSNSPLRPLRLHGSYAPLMCSLIGIVLLSPLIENRPLFATFVTSLVLLTSLFLVRGRRWGMKVLVIALIPSLAIRWAAHFAGDQWPWLVVAGHGAVGLCYALFTLLVLVSVMRSAHVTTNTILGAVCVYLLIAYFFSSVYAVVLSIDRTAIEGVQLDDPDVLHHGKIGHSFTKLLYFSFTVLTTVGFGDILPVSPVARSLAMLEMVCGQLYLAAFVARLVGGLQQFRERS